MAGETKIHIDKDTVQFTYYSTANVVDPTLLMPVERYRFQGTRALRLGPLAETWEGFTDEWLGSKTVKPSVSAPLLPQRNTARSGPGAARNGTLSPTLPSVPALRPRTKSEPSGTSRSELPTSALAATPLLLSAWNPSLTYPSPVAAPPVLTTSISACANSTAPAPCWMF